MLPRPSGHVALLTDYGTADPYAGVLRGAVLRHAPKALLVDFCHEVPAHDVAAGAFHVWAAIGRLPAGTVHVAVVDPGVGTARRLLAVAAAESYWLGPDNGLLGPLLRQPGAEVRVLDLEHLQVRPASRTFHGRDVLAPVAGWLCSGRYGFTALGPRCADPVAGPDLFAAPDRVLAVDRFGNLITNVAAERLAGCGGVRLAGRDLPLRGTYAEAAPGELLALVGSYGLLEVAGNGVSAAARLGAGPGATVALLPA